VFGIALAVVLRRVRRHTTAALVLAAAVAVVVVDTRTLKETTPLSWLPGADALPPAVQLAGAARRTAASCTCRTGGGETLYMMWALHHRHPIMNGYTAIMPRFGPMVRSLPSPMALQALTDAGVTHVLVHPRAMLGWGAGMVRRIAGT
jgi:hypothetical protein